MTLEVLDLFPFDFYGEIFSAAFASDRKFYVPLRDMCQTLGIQTNGQIRRIRDTEAIADQMVPLNILVTGSDEVAQQREMLCLCVEAIPFWLGSIQVNRISDPERRASVVRFQREFVRVAWAAFRTAILPADILAEMDASLPEDEQDYHQLMDQAAELRLDIRANREGLDVTRLEVAELSARLSDLEARLVGTDFLTPPQQKMYIDMVAIVAHLLKQKNRGTHATVHNEIKQRFQVPAYQLIPESEFEAVRQFLRSWYLRMAAPGTPAPAIF
ncbi:MAG: ORF6C domain-containing protein, partial [Anaerolineales bacterium]|nr:ORF6C domain-containing protein [Anaerolineales bacterium]